MTINIEELRRLAQAATPGPWTAKNVSGSGLEIHMHHPLYPDKEWPAFGTDSAFCKKGLVAYETWTQFPHEVRDVQQAKNASFIAAANPAAISELLDRLEAAESECLEESRLNGMGSEREAALMVKLEAAEKERDNANAAAAGVALHAGAMQARLEAAEKDAALKERVIDALGSELNAVANERNELQAKIAEMEKQEPFDADSDVFRSTFEVALKAGNWPATRQGDGYRSPSTQIAWRIAFSTVNRLKLYLATGAQPAPSVNEGVRKVTLDFRWESEAQHHIPIIEIEFEPVSPDSPNDAKGWQDRDRLAAMLTPEARS